MNRTKTGFTLIELLVVIAIIAILAAILFPVFTAVRSKGQAASCMSSMKQIGTAHTMYMDDYDSVLVPVGFVSNQPTKIYPGSGAVYWPDLLLAYNKGSRGIHKCPGARHFGIGMNHPQLGKWRPDVPGVGICRYSSVARPAQTVCFADTGLISNYDETDADKWREDVRATFTIVFRTPDNDDYYDVKDYATRVIGRHNGRANCAFLDGHILSLPVSKLGFKYSVGEPGAMWDIY